MERARSNIKKLTTDDLAHILMQAGMKRYRAGQIHEWIYRNFAATFEEMTSIPKSERAMLADRFYIPRLQVIRTERSGDGTKKFLLGLEDGHTVESVLIPDAERKTLCISSQVGCAQACRFCLTGSGGFVRNLEAFEITDQVWTAEEMLQEQAKAALPEAAEPDGARNPYQPVRYITNIVLMGMGEPLANFENVIQALRVITADKGLGYSPRRITVSTDGLAPEIERLGRSGVRVNLAVSLNATTDEVRTGSCR
jgi:23S rRNA (adenine2503-C2)-methyltransferase